MSMWQMGLDQMKQGNQTAYDTPDYLNVGGANTQVRWNVPNGAQANPTEMFQGGLLYGQKGDGQYAPLYSRRKNQFGPTAFGQEGQGEDNWGQTAHMQNPYNRIDYGHDGIETSNNYGDQWEFSFDAPNRDGWTYRQDDPMAQFHATDENPFVSQAGWYDAQGNRGDPNQGWGLSLGQSFGNNPESTFDSFWSDFGPLIMAPAAVATGGALAGAGWGGMAAGAGAGALTGGVNAGLTGGNILEGALGGGAAGGAMGGFMDWAGQGAGVAPGGGSAGGGEMYADSGLGTSSLTDGSSMMDSPVYDMQASNVYDAGKMLEMPAISETGAAPWMNSGMSSTVPGMEPINPLGQSIGGTSGMSDFGSMSAMTQLGSGGESLGYSTDPNSDTTFPGESTGFEGTMEGTRVPSTFDKMEVALRDGLNMFKDPIKAASAMHQLYQSKQHKKAMEDYMSSQEAQQQQAVADMQKYMDPNFRRQTIESHPAFNASRDFLTREKQRQLAQKGQFSQVGHGDTISNNWAVPMADVQAKNYMNFDNMMFGQFKDIAGQSSTNAAVNNSMRGAMMPKMAQDENDAYREVWNAITRNADEMPDALKQRKDIMDLMMKALA